MALLILLFALIQLKYMEKKLNKQRFKTKEAMILFSLTFGKNAIATFVSSKPFNNQSSHHIETRNIEIARAFRSFILWGFALDSLGCEVCRIPRSSFEFGTSTHTAFD